MTETPRNTTPGTILRSTLFYVIFIVSIPVTAILMWTAPLVSRFTSFDVCRGWGRLVNRLLEKICRIRLEVRGARPDDGVPALIVSNHTGPWETVAFMPLVPGDMTYVLKRQLIGWKYNFFALGLRSLKPIPISREANSGDFNTMQRLSAVHLVQKRSVLIFPGGTRKALSESLSFGPGGVLLARKLKCRILPVFVDSECWSRGRWFKDYGMLYPGAIRVHFGEPIPPGEVEQTKSRVLHERILSFMKQCAEEEKNRTPDRNDPGTGEDGAASPA